MLRALSLALGAAMLSFGWATSSPAGASPDEPAHIVYAWGTATGQTLPWTAHEETFDESVALIEVDVPNTLNERPATTCYAFKPSEPSCALTDIQQTGIAPQTSYMTRYPPLYYALVGLPLRAMVGLGMSGATALIGARTISGLISFAVLAFASISAARRFGRVPVSIAALATVTPQFLFTSSSINPNGFEIASAFSMASFVGCAFFDVKHGGTAKKDTSYGLVISALFLGLARPASVVWLIPLLALLLIRVRGAKAPWRGLPRVTIVLLSLALLASLASFVYMNGLRGGGISDHDTEGWGDLSFFTRLTVIVLKFGDLVYDGFGLLGWADTRLPMLFFVAWMVATVFAIGRAFPSNPSGSLLPTSWAFAVMAVFCLGVAGQSYLAAFGWQGRYFLPCLAAFVGLLVPTMSMRSTVPKSLRRVSITLLVTVAVIDTAALAWNSGRYLYGMSETYVRFGALPLASSLSEWHPLLGPSSPFILGASGALIIVGILIAGLRGNPAPDPAPVAHPRVDTPNGESSHPDPKTSSLLVGSDETRAPRNGERIARRHHRDGP